jgi:hypothetical protein
MNARWWRCLVVVLTSLGVAACAGLPQNLFPGREAREVTELLARFDQLVLQPTEEQRRELAAAQAGFEADPGEINRLRLALVLSMPQTTWRDDARVMALVGDWPGSELSLSREVAGLLYRQAADRQKMLKEEQRRLDGLRDDQRRAEAQLRDEQRRAEAQLRDERKKFEELQQKLEALRAIDRDARRAGRH